MIIGTVVVITGTVVPLLYWYSGPSIGLHMGPNNLWYVARHFLFFPCVAMSHFIRPNDVTF